MHNDADLPEEEINEDYKSKTRKKAEMTELQELGLAIAELPTEVIDKFSLSEGLRNAMLELKRIRHKNARRRHAQYIGKLMRDEDGALLLQQWQALQEEKHRKTRQFHLVEQWRDRLIQEGEHALAEFIDNYPTTDRQHLRQLIRAAEKEKSENKPPASARKLFKYVQEVLD